MSALLAALAAATIITAPAGDYIPNTDPTTYYLLPSDDVMDPVAQCLIALGWHGHQGDRMAAIYAPTVVIWHCGGVVSGQPSVNV